MFDALKPASGGNTAPPNESWLGPFRLTGFSSLFKARKRISEPKIPVNRAEPGQKIQRTGLSTGWKNRTERLHLAWSTTLSVAGGHDLRSDFAAGDRDFFGSFNAKANLVPLDIHNRNYDIVSNKQRFVHFPGKNQHDEPSMVRKSLVLRFGQKGPAVGNNCSSPIFRPFFPICQEPETVSMGMPFPKPHPGV